MKSKNIKVVDQNNIDRDASVMFAFELEGSEYVSYWIERDDDENNLFVSKVIKNTDGTSNLLDIENADEKVKISDIIKTLITKAVKDENVLEQICKFQQRCIFGGIQRQNTSKCYFAVRD